MPPSFPPDARVDLYYAGAWHDVTEDVRMRDGVSMAWGRRDEAAQVEPARCMLTLNNRHGRYSPRNPLSPLYGLIGRNTPMRVRVGDLPPDPAPVLVDTFDRTETDGWGTADSGQGWQIFDLMGATPVGDYSVSGGAGQLTLHASTDWRAVRAEVGLADFDATFTVRVSDVPEGGDADLAAFAAFLGRVDPVAGSAIAFNLRFMVSTGTPDGQGLRVATNIFKFAGGQTIGGAIQNVRGLTYSPGAPLRVRVQAVGSELRMRVWADGESEPAAWHSQAWENVLLDVGGIGLQSTASSTAVIPDPFVIAFSDVVVRPVEPDTGVVRARVEVSSWPPRWDVSEADRWVPVEGAGVLRRLGQGTSPVQSTMARAIPAYYPPAYWPFEEGRRGDAEVASGVEGGAPLAVRGLVFGEDSDVPGSLPLPRLARTGGYLRSGPIRMADTGNWSVQMLFRITESDFPAVGEAELLRWTTTGTARTWTITVGDMAGDPGMRMRALDEDGVELGQVFTRHTSAVAGGGPGLMDDWRRLRLYGRQVGGDIEFRFAWVDLLGASWGNTGTFTGTVGPVTRIDTALGDLVGLRLGHLTAWGSWNIPGAYLTFGLSTPAGLAGESARNRITRLAGEEDVPVLLAGRGASTLGPQPITTFLGAVRDAADTHMGVLHELRGEPGLRMLAREDQYNRPVRLTLDYAQGQLAPPLEPADDDQRVRNDITVSRVEGSSVRAVQETGPLSVHAPPAGVGPYRDSVSVNVHNDGLLPGQAWWRLHLGTVDDLRYPVVTINLANAAASGIIEDVMRLGVGDRIQIINPPSGLPPDPIDLIIEGGQERFNTVDEWTVSLNCSPARPWTVGHVAPEVPSAAAPPHRANTDGSELTTDVDATTTALEVASGRYENFEDAELLLDITPGGDAPWARDDSTAHTGSWSLRSGAITHDETSDAIVGVPSGSLTLQFWYRVDSEELFDFFRVLVDGVQILAVSGDTGGWVQSDVISVAAAATVTFRYAKDDIVTEGADAVWIDGLSFTSGPRWVDSATYPEDFPFDIMAGGERMTVTAISGASSPQEFTVTRSVNGVMKSQAAGSAIRLADPAIVAL